MIIIKSWSSSFTLSLITIIFKSQHDDDYLVHMGIKITLFLMIIVNNKVTNSTKSSRSRKVDHLGVCFPDGELAGVCPQVSKKSFNPFFLMWTKLTTSDKQCWTGLGQVVRILRTTFAEQASKLPHPSSPRSLLPSPSSPLSSPSPSTPASPARWDLTSISSSSHVLQLLWRDFEGPGCAGCRLQGGACPSHLRQSFGSLPRWLLYINW